MDTTNYLGTITYNIDKGGIIDSTTKTAYNLNNLKMLANRPKSTIKKLTKNSKIFKAIIEAIKEKKGENISELNKFFIENNPNHKPSRKILKRFKKSPINRNISSSNIARLF